MSSVFAASIAALNFITFPISGTIMRFDCFAALSEIPYQRFLFASSFFASSFTTARSVSTGRRIFGRGSGDCDELRRETGDTRKADPENRDGRNVRDGGGRIIAGIMKKRGIRE